MPVSFTDLQRQVLTAFADTIVAAVPRDPDPDRFFARAASDLGVAVVAEQLLQATASDRQLAGLTELLDTMAGLGLHTQPLPRREVIVKTVAASGPEARLGVDALRQLCALLAYGAPDPATGVNPFWSTWSYPGPGSSAPEMPKPITPLVPAGDTTIGADVVVVGSGSGGGVVAAELARAGASVVVVEMGGYFNEADFSQYELWAYQNLYLRGGYFPTADGNVSLVAGSALGGGSLVNWSNCIRPPADIRRRWAREFGLAGVDSEGFDAHVDAVLQRISATTDCSDYNDPHRRLREGADKLGWHLRTAALNLAPDRYNPDLAGYAGYGDQTGAKQGTLNTFLQDAVDAGAQVLVRTRVQRVLVADGRAVGVTGTFADPATGATTLVTIRAPHVVLACGALETPALLLRSGIGGPAVGRNLKLHPAVGVAGIYAEPQASWWGPPQAAILDEFAGKDADGTGAYGYLIEGIQHSLGLIAATVPWNSAGRIQRTHQQAGPHVVLRRPHPGPRRGHGNHRRGRQRRAPLPARRRTRPETRVRSARVDDPAARSRRRAGSPDCMPGAAPLAPWRGSRRLHCRRPDAPARIRRRPHVQRAPNGVGAHGHRPGDQRRPADRRVARRRWCLDRRHQRLPDLFRGQPDGLVHGIGTAHGQFHFRSRVQPDPVGAHP